MKIKHEVITRIIGNILSKEFSFQLTSGAQGGVYFSHIYKVNLIKSPTEEDLNLDKGLEQFGIFIKNKQSHHSRSYFRSSYFPSSYFEVYSLYGGKIIHNSTKVDVSKMSLRDLIKKYKI